MHKHPTPQQQACCRPSATGCIECRQAACACPAHMRWTPGGHVTRRQSSRDFSGSAFTAGMEKTLHEGRSAQQGSTCHGAQGSAIAVTPRPEKIPGQPNRCHDGRVPNRHEYATYTWGTDAQHIHKDALADLIVSSKQESPLTQALSHTLGNLVGERTGKECGAGPPPGQHTPHIRLSSSQCTHAHNTSTAPA